MENEKIKSKSWVVIGKNDSSSYLATSMLEGVGEDSGYGIG